MIKSKYIVISLTMIVFLLLMAACSGSSTVEDSAPEIEPTPTLVVVGSTADKPVPFGYDIILKNIVISVNEITRSADEIVAQSDGETPEPANGQEYLLSQGQSFQAADDETNPHLAFTDNGAQVFIVD